MAVLTQDRLLFSPIFKEPNPNTLCIIKIILTLCFTPTLKLLLQNKV